MSRILWLSNPPFAGSGYGEQTALFLPRLKALGHELAIAANFGLSATRLEWGGMPVYPTDGEWGNVNWPTYAQDFGADMTIALCDSWVMKPDTWPPGFKMAIWSPVDHDPMPKPVREVLSHDRIFPIAMSRFGERKMLDAGLECAYVPHAVDTSRFRPQPDVKSEVRSMMGVPEDAFLVGMVAANRGNPMIHRKGFPQALDAFARFSRRHDDAWMYIHASAFKGHGGGMDVLPIAKAMGCVDKLKMPPETAWHLTISHDFMAGCYQAFDVLLAPSLGEGFGIPILEAQACGVPVIVTDHTAMPELCHAGWLLDGDRWWDPPAEAFYRVPSIAHIELRLEEAYEARDDQALRASAAEWAQGYDADLVTEQFWKPALTRIEEWNAEESPNGDGGLSLDDLIEVAREAAKA